MKRRALLLASLATVGGGSALVLGWGMLPPRQRLQGSQPLRAGPAQHPVNGWVKLGSDDRITVMLARSEMGQGVSTALAMLLADELDADWANVHTEPAPIDGIYNNIAAVTEALPFRTDERGWVRQTVAWLGAKAARDAGLMVTAGSTSVKDLWQPMRQAGASARAMLLAAAAQTWRVPVAQCQAERGVVKHLASGRQLRFGELAAAAARQPVPRTVVLKSPAQFKLIGRPLLRRDAAAKQDGSARHGLDTVQPGQLYASVQMCPTLGGQAAAYDPQSALAMPGAKRVMLLPPLHGASGGVAVVADTPWHALRAAQAVGVRWQHGEAATFSSQGLMDELAQAVANPDGHVYLSKGDAGRALQGAATVVRADYQVPLMAHDTLEPQNCTVMFDPAARLAVVWAPTQVPDLARRAVAQVLGLSRDEVVLNVTALGGGFGRRLEVDVVAQAATVARGMPGVPVQTFWTREQDTTNDMYRPPCAARWQAGLDANGRLLGLRATSAGPSVVQQYLQRQFGLAVSGPDNSTVEGAVDQPYDWPAVEISHQTVALPVPVGFWRSGGHAHQAFFKESFIDECAHAVGRDPLAFRLELLKDRPRERTVLQRAAAMARWGEPPPPASDGAPTAWGMALHSAFGTVVAQLALVSVDPAYPSRVRVHRVVAAVDCGTVVNPNLVRQQLEGGTMFGLEAALYGVITMRAGRVQQSNFHNRPRLRLQDCPTIETEIINSNAPPQGMGEVGTPPAAPALANALFTLTGQRLRQLPLRPTRR